MEWKNTHVLCHVRTILYIVCIIVRALGKTNIFFVKKKNILHYFFPMLFRLLLLSFFLLSLHVYLFHLNFDQKVLDWLHFIHYTFLLKQMCRNKKFQGKQRKDSKHSIKHNEDLLKNCAKCKQTIIWSSITINP